MNSSLKLASVFLILGTIVTGSIVVYREIRKNQITVVTPQFQTVELVIGGKVLNARIADTNKLRKQGLSGTPELGEGNAMLFVFKFLGAWSFWMKDMNYPIDILWLDEAKKIVSIKEHATPDSYPEQFFPTAPSLYVIEVADGFVKDHKTKIGDQVLFQIEN